jgi:hypothetical protein
MPPPPAFLTPFVIQNHTNALQFKVLSQISLKDYAIKKRFHRKKIFEFFDFSNIKKIDSKLIKIK